MRLTPKASLLLTILLLASIPLVFGQDVDSIGDTATSATISSAIDSSAATTSVAPPALLVDTVVVIPTLDFANIRLYDALTALARSYNLSLFIDSSVTGNISLRLENVLLDDALRFIIQEYKLSWERTGDIIKIFKKAPPPPVLEPLKVEYNDSLLTLDLQDADLERLIDTLIDITDRNIIVEDRVKGKVTGKLRSLPLDQTLKVLLPANGFSIREIDRVIYVGRVEAAQGERARTRNLYVTCTDGLATLEAANVPIDDVVTRIGFECGVSILVQTKLEGTSTAQFTDKTVEEALTYLLMNSKYTFKEMSGVFFVGNRDSQDLYDNELIRVNNLVASDVEPLIPVALSQQLTVKVVKEHNGLLVTGPRTAIARLKDFVAEIDIPTAQVLFEVLVVDYSTTDRAEFGITANNFGGEDENSGDHTYWPNLDISGTGQDINNALRSLESHTGWSNLGVLDDNFFVRLQMLQEEGKANIQSRPQIATLNGHSASISIGTTQYYLLESQTIYPSDQSNISTSTSQKFETIKANMSLVVTPYVSIKGDVIVDIAPEFNTPSGQLDPDTPPTINSRVLSSTVRLEDGQTIVLGGLIQNNKSVNVEKVPILGSIPLLGLLFQNRTTTNDRSELMIYVTPHVYFGSEGAVNRDSLIIRK